MSYQVTGDPSQGAPPAAGPRRSPLVWVSPALGITGLGLAVGSLFGAWVENLGRGGTVWRLVGQLGQQFGERSAAPAGYLLVTVLLLVAVVLATMTRGRVQQVARVAGAALAVVGLVNLLGAALDTAGLFFLDPRPWPMRPGLTIWLGLAATVLLGLAAALAAGRDPVSAPVSRPQAPRWPWTFWVSGSLTVVGVVLYVVSIPAAWRLRILDVGGGLVATETPETIVGIMQAYGYGGGISQMVIYLATTPILMLAVVPAHLLPGRVHRLGRVVLAVLGAGALANLVALLLDVSGMGHPKVMTYAAGPGFWLGLLAVVMVGAALVLAPGDLIGRLTRGPVPPPSNMDAVGGFPSPAQDPTVGGPAPPRWG